MPIWWCFLHAKPVSAELRDGEGILRGIRSQTSVCRALFYIGCVIDGREPLESGKSINSSPYFFQGLDAIKAFVRDAMVYLEFSSSLFLGTAYFDWRTRLIYFN